MKKSSFKNLANKKTSNAKSYSKPAGKPAGKFQQRSSQPQNHAPRNSATSSSAVIQKSWRQITGVHAVKEALKIHGESIKYALVQKGTTTQQDTQEILKLLKDQNVKFEERAENDLFKICPSHQGLVLFSDFNPSFDYTTAGWDEQSLVVALDGVEDPHNLGAILRTSWLMNVKGLIIPQDRAVGLTATVHKVACGGVEHVPVARINNFSDPFAKLKEAGFWVYGLSHKAKKTIYEIDYPEKVIWVLGAEDKGLRVPTERVCDELVCIPQLSPDASYNVSVATGMALSETTRQWMSKK